MLELITPRHRTDEFAVRKTAATKESVLSQRVAESQSDYMHDALGSSPNSASKPNHQQISAYQANTPARSKNTGRRSLFSFVGLKHLGVLLLLAGRSGAIAKPFSFAELCDEQSPRACLPAMAELQRRDKNGKFAEKYDRYEAYWPMKPVRSKAINQFSFEDGPEWNTTHKTLTRGRHGTKVFSPVDALAHAIINQQDYVLFPIVTHVSTQLYHPLLGMAIEVRTENLREAYFSKVDKAGVGNPLLCVSSGTRNSVPAETLTDDSLHGAHQSQLTEDINLPHDNPHTDKAFPLTVLQYYPGAADLHATFWQ